MGKIDQYLIPGKSQERLIDEFVRYKSLVIAYDFDNTVNDYHEKGETYHNVIDLLRNLKRIGCYLIVFTANNNRAFISHYLKSNQIPFDSINEDPPHFKHHKARKIYFNALLDDRAGLLQVYNELSNVVKFHDQMKTYGIQDVI